MVNSGAVADFHDCFRDAVRELVAKIGVASLFALAAVAEKSALHQHRGITGIAQHAETRRLNAPIHRFRQAQQISLDALRQIGRGRIGIVNLEAMHAAPRGVVEMNADEDGIGLSISDRDAFVEGNEDIRAPSEDRAQLRFAQFFPQTLRDVERDNFFRRPETTGRAIVPSAVSGIDHNGTKSAQRIFLTGGFGGGTTR